MVHGYADLELTIERSANAGKRAPRADLELTVERSANAGKRAPRAQMVPSVTTKSTASTEQETASTSDRSPHCISCTCFVPQNSPDNHPTSTDCLTVPRINSSERWYVVSKGRKVGVFSDWSVLFSFFSFHVDYYNLSSRHLAFSHVNGVSGACVQRHTSKAAAEAAFEAALEAGEVGTIV